MRRAKFTRVFERRDVIEQLAREFYKLQGCDFPEDKCMIEATHPQEALCVQMAIAAVNRLCVED